MESNKEAHNLTQSGQSEEDKSEKPKKKKKNWKKNQKLKAGFKKKSILRTRELVKREWENFYRNGYQISLVLSTER